MLCFLANPISQCPEEPQEAGRQANGTQATIFLRIAYSLE